MENMASINPFCLMVLLLALMIPAPSFAEMTLLLTPIADDTYVLGGNNLKSVEAVEMTINYDTTFFANVQAGVQGGTLTQKPENFPGGITVNVLRADPDTAFELYFTFEKRGDSPGTINFATATVRDMEGKIYPVRVSIIPRSVTPLASPVTIQEDGEAAEPVTPGGEAIFRIKSVLQR